MSNLGSDPMLRTALEETTGTLLLPSSSSQILLRAELTMCSAHLGLMHRLGTNSGLQTPQTAALSGARKGVFDWAET